jgi:predicted dehydrogenase
LSVKARILLVAIGGYGANYVRALLDHTDPAEYSIEGVVDPYAERSDMLPRLRALGVECYGTIDEFYSRHEADLTIISSPIHHHCVQTCEALAHGSHVLCEKPVAATIQEARRMIKAREAAGRFVSIGYNWSFSPEIQALKQDIMSGLFGKPLRLKCICLSPRDEAYYTRNNWAGVLRMPSGEWVLDSPINNAVSHYLHNMLYLLGDAVDGSARPTHVTAELYRANEITSFDTGAARIRVESGAELLFYASHAVSDNRGVRFLFEFEGAAIEWNGGPRDPIRVQFVDGGEKLYAVDQSWEKTLAKLWQALDCMRTGRKPVCGLEAASAHTLCVNGIHDSQPDIVGFPQEITRVTGPPGRRLTYVEGLESALEAAYEAWKLPAEMGIPWAVAGQWVDVTDYGDFPGGGRA